MSTLSTFTYPYNPNGVLTECNITGESHTITPSADRNYNWFVPFAAPFFGFSVVIRHVASGKTLQRGVDYNFGLEYHIFNTQVTLRQVYGAIVLIDTALTGQFQIDYMTIGGQYAIDQTKALALVANAQLDPRQTYWENVTDIPSQFPVTQHLHNVSDVTGMADVVLAIQALQAAFETSGGKWWQALNEHLNDFNDPHRVLEMIPGGAGGTPIPKATQEQAITGTDNTAYMTVLRVAQWYSANKQNDIDAINLALTAIQNWTKADIGLGQVENLPMGTTVDVDNNTNQGYYASLAVAKYIANKAVSAIDTSTFVTQTALQTLLQTNYGNVPNFGPADISNATDPSVNDKLMTPAMTDYAITAWGPVQTLGVVTTTAQRNTYLAQTTVRDAMVDLATGETYVYDTDNAQWVLDATAQVTDAVKQGRVYYNQVTRFGYLCTGVDGTVIPVITPTVMYTVSAATPPTDTSGYLEGHVWYQLS